MFAVGVGAALLASAMFNVGLALQAFEARATPKQRGLRVSLLGLLLRKPLWAVGVLPFALERLNLDRTLLIVVAAGAGFGATNIATKLVSDDFGQRHWAEAIAWAVGAIMMGGVATITEMTAFQRAPATVVAPT